MKIERINENQIRCTLSSFDLSVRNLNLGELAYGSEKARNLFREMIQKASNEVGFDVEDIPLMVEAIPLSNESVMLVITKIEDPEDLDTRFSKFSQIAEEDLVPRNIIWFCQVRIPSLWPSAGSATFWRNTVKRSASRPLPKPTTRSIMK